MVFVVLAIADRVFVDETYADDLRLSQRADAMDIRAAKPGSETFVLNACADR